MQPKTRRAAWLQGAAFVAAAVAIATTLSVRVQRPFDRDTLPLPVGELRSQAAEAAALAKLASQDELAPAFVRYHARQLGHDVQRARDDLAGKPAVAGLDPLRRRALGLAGALEGRIDVLARDGHPAPAGARGLQALADALDDLAARIKPES